MTVGKVNVDALTGKDAAKKFLALLDEDTAKKESVVKALADLASAWESVYTEAKTLQDFHGKMLNMVQTYRDDCADLESLDARALRGAGKESKAADKTDAKK